MQRIAHPKPFMLGHLFLQESFQEKKSASLKLSHSKTTLPL